MVARRPPAAARDRAGGGVAAFAAAACTAGPAAVGRGWARPAGGCTAAPPPRRGAPAAVAARRCRAGGAAAAAPFGACAWTPARRSGDGGCGGLLRRSPPSPSTDGGGSGGGGGSSSRSGVSGVAPTMLAATPASLVVIGGAVAFFLSAALGANDVANSLGTSVGTGAVKVSQALLIGAVMEFSGAVLFGSTVTKTVSAGVVTVSAATLANPVGYMLGMLSVLVGCTLWMATATKLGLPVSSTHAVVGSLVGIGLVSGWGVNVSAVTNIVSSWFLSPFIGGAIAVTLYAIIQRYILKAPRPAKAIRRFLPLLSGFASFVLSLFVLFKGAPFAAVPKGNLLVVAAAISAFVSGISLALSTAIHSRTYIKAELGVPDDAESPEERVLREQGDVERIFKVLQVVTACLLAFSHGSNDVSNAIGPFAAMYSMWANGGVGATVAIPLWVLVLGGIGISTGLGIWGRPVMETVGKKITSLVPTKGFAVELSTALTVLIASEFGLPVSTTQVLVGCIVAIGLSAGDKDAVNAKVLKNIALSWGVTLPVSAAISVVFYLLCQPLVPPVAVAAVASRLAALPMVG